MVKGLAACCLSSFISDIAFAAFSRGQSAASSMVVQWS